MNSGGGDLAHLSYAQGNTPERALNALPFLSIHLRAAGACRQVQAAHAGRTLAAHGTGCANVAGPMSQILASATPAFSMRPSTIILRTVSTFRTWPTATEIDCRSSKSILGVYPIHSSSNDDSLLPALSSSSSSTGHRVFSTANARMPMVCEVP